MTSDLKGGFASSGLNTIASPYLASMPRLQGEEGGTVFSNAGKATISLSSNPQLQKISLMSPHSSRITRLSGVYSVKGKAKVSPLWLSNDPTKNSETVRNSTTVSGVSGVSGRNDTMHASRRSLNQLEQER